MRTIKPSLVACIGLFSFAANLHCVSGQVQDNLSTSPIRAVAFSPDGKLLAASTANGLADGKLAVWNTKTWEQVAFRADEKGFPRVTFSPDSELLAVSRFGLEMHLLNARTGRLVKELQGHTNYARSAIFSPDGSSLFTGGYDGTVRKWDIESGEQIDQLSQGFGQIQHLDITSDGRYLAIADAKAYIAHVWDLDAERLLYTTRRMSSLVPHVSFSPSGDKLAVSTWGGYSWIFDATTGNTWNYLDTNSCNWTVFSPDESMIAVAQYMNQVFVFSFGTPEQETEQRITSLIEDFENGDYELRNRAFDELIQIGGVAEPYLRKAMESDDAEVRWRTREILDRLTSTDHAKILELETDAQCAEFSPDGKFLVTGENSGAIIVWSTEDWSVIRRLGIPANH